MGVCAQQDKTWLSSTNATCEPGDAVTCPGTSIGCKGNTCCPDGSTCPSAEEDFGCCPQRKKQDCVHPSPSPPTPPPPTPPAPPTPPTAPCKVGDQVKCPMSSA